MSFKSTSLRAMGLLVALTVAGAAQAGTKYYSVNGGGGQAQIGDGLPIPAQDQFSSMGGKNGTMAGPIGTYTNFPPLLVPLNTKPEKRLIKQTTTMTAQPKMTVPPGVFRRIPTTNNTPKGVPVPSYLGVAKNNQRVVQVRTTLSFSGPAPMLTTPKGAKAPGTIMFATGQRPATKANVTYNGPPNGKVIYKTKGARFGGASQTKIKNLGLIGVWADIGDQIKVATLPCIHPTFGGPDNSCFATKVAAYPRTLGAAGGPKSNVVTTPGTPFPMPGKVALSVDTPTPTNGMAGTILKSAALNPLGTINNMATSVGFPWTTGAVTISQPAAIPTPEKFHITGMDGRVKGVGTIQLVSASLSQRIATGPNANRSWAEYQLPEPGAVLGAAAALAVLGLCHGLVRRRR